MDPMDPIQVWDGFYNWFFSFGIFIRFQTDVQEVKLYSVSVTVTNWKAYLAPGDTAWWNFIDLCDTMSKVMQISNMCNTIGHLPSGVNYTIKMSAKCCDSGRGRLEDLHDCAAKSWSKLLASKAQFSEKIKQQTGHNGCICISSKLEF